MALAIGRHHGKEGKLPTPSFWQYENSWQIFFLSKNLHQKMPILGLKTGKFKHPHVRNVQFSVGILSEIYRVSGKLQPPTLHPPF